jgi:hypothetical protein
MSITPPSNIPLSVDYTSKDFYSIRAELIARIQDRIPEWTASDPADFGVALVEAFSYLGDMVSYYIDRNANEGFISTATQRSSVLSIAQTYGYNPAGYRAAFVTATFSNTSGTAVVLPSGTVLTGEVIEGDTVQPIYFSTNIEIEVPAKVGSIVGTEDVTVYHGRSITLIAENANEYGELIGESTGRPGMRFELSETPVVEDSVEIYVQDGDIYTKWTQVQHIIDYDSTDQVFSVVTDDEGNVSIIFGDGVSGTVPTLYSEIRAKYTVGGGSFGNIVSGVLDTIDYVPGLSEAQVTALQSTLTVTNSSAAVGGSDPEDTNQIRLAAPQSLRANTRAVTLQDFADLALAVTGVGKANATASVWTSVTVYISPTRTATDSDPAPGLDENGDPTLEFDSLQDDVEVYLSDKTLIGTTVTISPPVYIDAVASIQYTKLDQYTNAEIELGIKNKVLTDFGYTGVFFEDTIYPQDIEFALQQVPGIKVAKVTQLYRDGDSPASTTLVGDPDEIFRFTEANLNITEI